MGQEGEFSELNWIIGELIQTEESYIGVLTDILDGYAEALNDNEVVQISESDDNSLFGSVREILKFQRGFLRCLKEADRDAVKVAECFIDHSAEFMVYAEYYANHPRSREVLLRLLEDPAVDGILRQQQKKLGHKFPLRDCLLRPTQRLLQYHLFLQRMVKKHKAAEEGHDIIVNALETMLRIDHQINEKKRHHERIQELRAALCAKEGDVDIAGFGDLVREGDFQLASVWGDRHVIVFRRAVVIGKKLGAGLLRAQAVLWMSNLVLVETLHRKPLHFVIHPFDSRRPEFTLQAKSTDEKELWCQTIRILIFENFPYYIPKREELQVALDQWPFVKKWPGGSEGAHTHSKSRPSVEGVFTSDAPSVSCAYSLQDLFNQHTSDAQHFPTPVNGATRKSSLSSSGSAHAQPVKMPLGHCRSKSAGYINVTIDLYGDAENLLVDDAESSVSESPNLLCSPVGSETASSATLCRSPAFRRREKMSLRHPRQFDSPDDPASPCDDAPWTPFAPVFEASNTETDGASFIKKSSLRNGTSTDADKLQVAVGLAADGGVVMRDRKLSSRNTDGVEQDGRVKLKEMKSVGLPRENRTMSHHRSLRRTASAPASSQGKSGQCQSINGMMLKFKPRAVKSFELTNVRTGGSAKQKEQANTNKTDSTRPKSRDLASVQRNESTNQRAVPSLITQESPETESKNGGESATSQVPENIDRDEHEKSREWPNTSKNESTQFHEAVGLNIPESTNTCECGRLNNTESAEPVDTVDKCRGESAKLLKPTSLSGHQSAKSQGWLSNGRQKSTRPFESANINKSESTKSDMAVVTSEDNSTNSPESVGTSTGESVKLFEVATLNGDQSTTSHQPDSFRSSSKEESKESPTLSRYKSTKSHELAELNTGEPTESCDSVNNGRDGSTKSIDVASNVPRHTPCKERCEPTESKESSTLSRYNSTKSHELAELNTGELTESCESVGNGRDRSTRSIDVASNVPRNTSTKACESAKCKCDPSTNTQTNEASSSSSDASLRTHKPAITTAKPKPIVTNKSDLTQSSDAFRKENREPGEPHESLTTLPRPKSAKSHELAELNARAEPTKSCESRNVYKGRSTKSHNDSTNTNKADSKEPASTTKDPSIKSHESSNKICRGQSTRPSESPYTTVGQSIGGKRTDNLRRAQTCMARKTDVRLPPGERVDTTETSAERQSVKRLIELFNTLTIEDKTGAAPASLPRPVVTDAAVYAADLPSTTTSHRSGLVRDGSATLVRDRIRMFREMS